MFHVPESYRLTSGVMASDRTYGNNGAFVFRYHRVIIEGHDSEFTLIRFEPYLIRWEHEEVIIEASFNEK